MTIKVSASILASDFANLAQEVKDISAAGADFIHFDVMDGAFVPNITIGSAVIKALRNHTNLPFDTHLMVNDPERHIEDFAKAGSDIITIHTEAVTHLDRAINQIHALGKKAGVSLVPSTNESCLQYLLDKIDLILVMGVNPGFGGQDFMESQLVKINSIRKMIGNRKITLSVDGGVNHETAPKIIAAGSDLLVAGNAIFKSNDYRKAISSIVQGYNTSSRF